MTPNAYDLDGAHRRKLIQDRVDSLRAERCVRQVAIAGWEAIPVELRDSTEQPAIDQARREIAVIEAQIDGMRALL